ncbi:hypothetical protein ACK6D9_21465 [Hoeflea sp. Naph1]|uniref:hypothetical protein n=1 Tax=Hoeflea sp. Naph1 TaxID=3388653 RepID=UPI00398FF7A4
MKALPSCVVPSTTRRFSRRKSLLEHVFPDVEAPHVLCAVRSPITKVPGRLDRFFTTMSVRDIMLLIRVFLFGNSLGASPAVSLGQKVEGSSVLVELLFDLASFWIMMPETWLLQQQCAENPTPTPIGEYP